MIIGLSPELLKHTFHFLEERERLHLMITSKRFAPLLKERLAVAKEALESLRAKFPKLFFLHNDCCSVTGWNYYHSYSVRLYRGDPDVGVPGDLGLLCITDNTHGYSSNGIRFNQDPIELIFSPWACAFVHPETHEDDRPVGESDKPTELRSRLVRASRRVV